MERIEILRDLRAGEFDVLVGINLLREGLDLPEVSLVAILDADKEGFLRSSRSLIQTIGRAARNSRGQVMMYADRETDAMKFAISETYRRRAIQVAYNTEHGITPATIKRAIFDMNPASGTTDYYAVPKSGSRDKSADGTPKEPSEFEVLERIEAVRQEMFAAAESLQFETAARLRDELKRLQGLAGDAIPASTRGGAPRSERRSERPSARPKARAAQQPRKRK
jgi:excinuclease ABC subunit B